MIVCIGLNFRDPAVVAEMQISSEPVLFLTRYSSHAPLYLSLYRGSPQIQDDDRYQHGRHPCSENAPRPLRS